MKPRQEWHLDTRHIGRRVLVFDQLESTNSHAALLAADPGNDGIAVLASVQTAGRGQHDRRWLCQPGAGVLLSILVFPPAALRRPAVITAWAAVSVCDLIGAAVGFQAAVKWPNDVLVDGKKVCGILIEQARGTVVGIGLNANQSATWLEGAGLPDAGSLALFAGQPFDIGELAVGLLRRLDHEYASLQHGKLESLEARWRSYLGLVGRQVMLECSGAVYSGQLLDVTFDALQLQCPLGPILRLPPETVRHLCSSQC